MPETLTESFCERCGSRYTFESAAPKQRMRGMRVLSRGVKNFVLDDKTSFDEAMASARMDTDRESTNAQLDAFHSTFNFCMDCRQYTCPNCWNEAEGRCLGCAPLLGDAAPAAAASPFLSPVAHPFSAPSNGTAATNGHALVEPDAEFDPLARLAFLTAASAPAPEVVAEPESEAVLEPEPVAAEPEVVLAAESEVVLVAEPESVVEQPAVVVESEITAEPEVVLRAAADVVLAAEPEDAAEPEPFVAAQPEVIVEPEVAAEPEPVLAADPGIAPELAAAAEPEPEAIAAASETESVPDAPFVPIPVPRIELEPEGPSGPTISTDPLDPTTDHPAAAAVRTSVIFSSLRPGESLDEAIAAFDEVEPEPEPIVAAEPEPVVVAAQPESIAVQSDLPVETEPEPSHVAEAFLAAALAPEFEPAFDDEPEPIVAAEPEPVVSSEPEPVVISPTPVIVAPPVEAPAIAATAAPVDVVPQPTWTVIAPDPVVPAEPEWPSHQVAAAGLPFLGRPAVPTGGVDALWAASSEQVGAPSPSDRGPVTGVQECVSCGLSLSATARFCRRCGSAQHA